MLYDLLDLLLPMFLMMGIGMLCRRFSIISKETVDGAKKLITSVFLPFVIFGCFSGITLSGELLIIIAVCFGILAAAFKIGFLTSGRVPGYEQCYPFLLTSVEPGMLGYALISMVFGKAAMSYMALYDFACAPFFFIIYFPAINRRLAKDPQPILRAILMNPIVWAIASGILLNATGAWAALQAKPIGSVLSNTISAMGEPVNGLIFFIVGYSMAINRAILPPVLKTCGMRLAAMAALCLVATGIYAIIGMEDPMYRYAMYLIFALPASFTLPVFAQREEFQNYISTQLSLHTLISIAVAAVLKLLAK